MAVRWSYNKRERFANENERKCAHCGKENLVSKRDSNGDYSVVYNIDHIFAKAKGGTDDESNLQLLCFDCNTSKQDASYEDFVEHHALKSEIEEMQTELLEITGLDDVLIKRMLHSFSVKDKHKVLSKLL